MIAIPANATGLFTTTTIPPLSIPFILDDTPPTVTTGYGGWQEVARPRRKSITEWQGTSPLRIQIWGKLDAFGTGGNVEAQIKNMEKMSTGGDYSDPPTLNVFGAAIPHQGVNSPGNGYVVDSLTWGTDVIKGLDGQRMRQDFDIVLLEYVPDLYIVNGKIVGAAIRTVQVKKAWLPHPIRKIAALYYPKKKGMFRAIMTKNNIRDEKNVKAGRTIILP